MRERYPIPSQPPTYQHWTPHTRVPKRRIYELLDSVFAGIGLALTGWYTLLLVLVGLSWNWQSVVLLVAAWLALTYLVLPRIHQMFTTLYIPDYFLARTKTGDGLLGDPVNLALKGTARDVHAAMRRAGWTLADEITLRSALGIVKSSVTGKSYASAPVSNLFLFGERHAFAYQQEVDGSAAQRHHVRFWPVPEGRCLPGGASAQWLAAGTYDRSVGLSTMTLQVTHKIDPNIDAERDYIIETIRYADPECSVEVLQNFSTAFHDMNGGGDAVFTDGDLPILDVRGAATRACQTSGATQAATTAGATQPTSHSTVPTQAGGHEVCDDVSTSSAPQTPMNRELPPKPFLFSGVVLLVDLVVLLLGAITQWAHLGSPSDAEEWVSLGAGLGITGTLIALYVLTLKRFKWARLALLILACVAATGLLINVAAGPSDVTLSTHIDLSLHILLVLALSAPNVREYVYAKRRRGGLAETFPA